MITTPHKLRGDKHRFSYIELKERLLGIKVDRRERMRRGLIVALDNINDERQKVQRVYGYNSRKMSELICAENIIRDWLRKIT